jgi:CheY-like chemotaxis protein
MLHHPPVVLIVDDHRDSLALYALGLLSMGFQPVIAENSEDGFERACRVRPDVIVTDLLSRVAGLELSRRLRLDGRTKHITIIVLAWQTIGAAEQHACGYDRYVQKPCTPDALAVEIRAALTDRDRSA